MRSSHPPCCLLCSWLPAPSAAVAPTADDAWLTEMATCLSKQLRRLPPADCLATVQAYSTWCSARQQQPQHDSDSNSNSAVAPAVHGLAAGLLVQMSAAAPKYSALQLSTAISSIALQLGFRPDPATAQDAAAVEGLTNLLQQLLHAQGLAEVPTRQVVGLVQGLSHMQVIHG
jgi:hypothetical protein